MKTYFASPERKPLEEISVENQAILNSPILRDVLNLLPHLLFVLNSERQMVFCNPALLHFLSMKDYQEILGLRAGEILQCIHAWENEGGCGTSRHCQYCGAAEALLIAQRTHEPASHECRISCEVNGKLHAKFLQVHVYPYLLKNIEYYLFYIEDISAVKFKDQLEQTFYHDFNNLLTVLLAQLEIFPTNGLTHQQQADYSNLLKISTLMFNEIHAQRDFNRLLLDNLPSHKLKVNTHEILAEMSQLIQITFTKPLSQDPTSVNLSFTTDKAVLLRVMLNLLKNAFEACNDSETIRVGCKQENKNLIFWVHTPSVISEPIQAQLFEYGTSSKGKGRGIGLYSSKLYTEIILGGKITFESNREKGTTFFITIPLSSPELLSS